MSTRTKPKAATAKASAAKTGAKNGSAKAKAAPAKKKAVAPKPAPSKPKAKEAPKAAAKATAKPTHPPAHPHPAHAPAKPAHPPAKAAPQPAKAAAPTAAAKPTASAKPPMGKPVLVKPVPAKPHKPLEDVSFRAGDHVVYPTHGVGKVLGIESQEISGHSLQVITVHFEKDRMTLRVPVSKARNSGLRRLSSRKVMDTALQTLKGRSRVKRTMWSRRAQEYEAKINSGDPVSIAEVVRDLHRNADQPDQSYSERQIYQAALDRLVRELAAVEDIDEQSATQRLEQLLKAA
jgi:CarD family transcriptional regulator